MMLKAAEKWSKLTDDQQKPYEAKADSAKELFKEQLAEREKNGYFTFEDETKSTDPENEKRVAKNTKEEPAEEEKSDDKKKSRLQKAIEGDDDDEEPKVLHPRNKNDTTTSRQTIKWK